MWKSGMEAHSGITLYSAENRSSEVHWIFKISLWYKYLYLLSATVHRTAVQQSTPPVFTLPEYPDLRSNRFSMARMKRGINDGMLPHDPLLRRRNS